MKKILMLGSSGFIGRNMFEYFTAQKEKYDVHAPSHKELDVLAQHEVEKYLNEYSFDAIINCLDVTDNFNNYMKQRLQMFSNLYKYRSLYGKMVYFGSGAEYDRFRPLTNVSETDFGKIVPSDDYGLCLYYMSLLSEQSSNIYNFRLFGIFGKYELWNKRFISNAICKKIFGYPITIRENRIMDYLDIEDLCKITEWAIEKQPIYRIYNAVSGMARDLKTIAEMINGVKGSPVPVFLAKESIAPTYSASNLRLKTEMGLECKDLSKSIKDLYNWYETTSNHIDKYLLLYQN